MRPTDGTPDAPGAPGSPAVPAALPPWPAVLRALREARGVTQDGWAARLGVSRKTVQRWEGGERAPDPGAEAGLLGYCREAGLLRAFAHGPLAGLTLTEAGLRDLLAEARGRGPTPVSAPPLQPSGASPRPGGAPEPGQAAAPVPPGDDAVPLAGPIPRSAAPPAPAPTPELRTVPPPESPEPPTNLPVALTSFVGRELELAAVRRVQAGTRLLTLTGPGGAGKTRLALALAAELRWAYPHGIWFADLAPLADPALLPEAVASALAVRAAGQQLPTAALLEALRARRLLLVLDNCEHLLPACADLAEALLRACPHLEVLATSREPLGVPGETVWRVPPLAVPPLAVPPREPSAPGGTADAADAADATAAPGSPPTAPAGGTTDAERLFVARARLRRPEFSPTPEDTAAIAEICRRLDGMPLAIELAAARVGVLAVGQIASRLGDRFRLLTGGARGAPTRQQTLRATLDWSYDLLAEPERVALRALAVFAGGFSLEAAEAVCSGYAAARRPESAAGAARGEGAATDGSVAGGHGTGLPPAYSRLRSEEVLDLLARLVDKSLVVVDEPGGAAGGAGSPSGGPRAVVRYRLLETVRQYAAELLTDPGEGLAVRQRHSAWCLALAESAAAALDGPHQVDWLARLDQEHDNLRQALGWSLEQGQRLGERERQAATTTALRLAAALPLFWVRRGHLREGRRWLLRALAVADEAAAVDRARALRCAGILAYQQGDFAAARAPFERSLALYRELADEHGIALAERSLGETALRQGDYATARSLLEASLVRHEAVGYKRGIANLQYTLGVLSFRRGDYGTAGTRYEASLAFNREMGSKHGIANALAELASVRNEQGADGGQTGLLEESLALYRELGEKHGVAAVLGHLGMHAWAHEDYERAQPLLSEGLALYREVENRRGIARLLGIQSLVAYSRHDYARAAALCRESLTLHRAVDDTWEIGRYLWVLAGAAFGLEEPERAARLFGAAAAVRERLGASLPPLLRGPHDCAVAAVRRSLGEPAFAAAWAAGHALSLEEVAASEFSDMPPV